MKRLFSWLQRSPAVLDDFEDGGKPGEPRHTGSRAQATQQGAATPGQEATAQGAVPVAGNVAEPQFDPTPDRIEHPPSSPSTKPALAKAAATYGATRPVAPP